MTPGFLTDIVRPVAPAPTDAGDLPSHAGQAVHGRRAVRPIRATYRGGVYDTTADTSTPSPTAGSTPPQQPLRFRKSPRTNDSTSAVRTVPKPGEFDKFDRRIRPVADRDATVMLVRDAAEPGDGIEAFMLRRTMGAVFGAGFYVFPGGRLDDADGDRDARRDLRRARRRGGERARSGFRAAASRIGSRRFASASRRRGCCSRRTTRCGRCSSTTPPRSPASRSTARGSRRTLSLVELCAPRGPAAGGGTRSRTSAIGSRPSANPGASTRGSCSPALHSGQEPLHDDGETIASLWISPADALATVHGRARCR